MEPAQTLQLVGDQQLVVESSSAENILHVIGRDGFVKLALHVTPDGPVVKFEGAGILIQSTGTLAIDAQSVVIRGREGVALVSGGNAEVRVAGDLTCEARVQSLTATLGNVNIKANDDVKLNGERVMMNC
jgi:hypothetical protein